MVEGMLIICGILAKTFSETVTSFETDATETWS